MKKAVLYINQFFAGIGGEELADQEPILKKEAVGPGLAFKQFLDDIELTHTIICGDNFMGSREEEAKEIILEMLKNIDFDIFFAGPTFNAGRYGFASGTICKAVQDTFKVPAISSMNEENPGVNMFKKDIIIFKGGKSAASMRKDVEKMAKYANRLLKNEKLLPADEEGYYGRGIRNQVWPEGLKPAAQRGVDMLIKKLKGEPYQTELPVPKVDMIPVANAIKDLSKARIAIMNTGGIVPIDNPDKIQSASATRWGRYDISSMPALKSGEFKTIHAGFDPAAANADPNVIVPVDSMKKLLAEGVYGSLHPYFYSTVGTGTTQAEAARMAKEILTLIQEDNVDAVLMIST